MRITLNPLRLILQNGNELPLEEISSLPDSVHLRYEDTDIILSRCPDGGFLSKKGELCDIDVSIADQYKMVSEVNIIEDISGNRVLRLLFRK